MRFGAVTHWIACDKLLTAQKVSGYLDSQGDLTNNVCMTTLDELERQWTLTTVVARYEQLRSRDSLTDPFEEVATNQSLSRADALELLALGEVIARKAGYGRQLAVRTARTAGASWAQIGQALGTSRQSAWETHARWIDGQVRQHAATGYEGLDECEAARAGELAGATGE